MGKAVNITGNRVLVAGVSRMVNWGKAKHYNVKGTIASVEESYLGKVKLKSGQEFENGGFGTLVRVCNNCLQQPPDVETPPSLPPQLLLQDPVAGEQRTVDANPVQAPSPLEARPPVDANPVQAPLPLEARPSDLASPGPSAQTGSVPTEITITKDLADLCVEEGQQTRASVEITCGDLLMDELSINGSKSTATPQKQLRLKSRRAWHSFSSN